MILDMIGNEIEIGDLILYINPGKGSLSHNVMKVTSLHGTTQIGLNNQKSYFSKKPERFLASRGLLIDKSIIVNKKLETIINNIKL